TTLEALRKKGAITEDDYNSALRDLISVGQRASSAPTFVVGRFVTTLYGYLEGDVIHDSQRAALDSYGGNPTLQLPGTFLGDNGFVTLSIGQTWNLMAFAAAYLPTSVQPQGLPGQLFGRNPQVRLSHIFDAKVFSVEAAAAAVRSPQFDAEMPDLQGGLKFNINGWTGVQSIGSTATVISPASIAVTGGTRKIKMATTVSGTNAPTSDTVNGNVVALNAFVPVIPATQRGPFALSLLGEAGGGTGMGDRY